MKITDIRVRGGRLSSLTFVQVETDEGLTGIGVTGSPSWIIEPIVLDRQGGLSRFLAGPGPTGTRPPLAAHVPGLAGPQGARRRRRHGGQCHGSH